MHRLSFTAASICLLFTARASALIVYGEGATTTTYLAAPANGAPWSHVVQQQVGGTVDASGVYLGNGYVLTANHTNAPTAVIIENVSYTPDPAFEAVNFGSTDLRLYRIANPPTLPLLPLLDLTETDTNKATTLIGWGKGKGAAINGGIFGARGWYWGGEETKLKRWGTNTTFATVDDTSLGYNALVVNFSSSPSSEAVAALGDSGSPFFQKFGSVWKLAGITSAVTSSSYPDSSLYSIPASQTYAVRLRDLADRLRFAQWKQARSIAANTPDDTDADSDGLGLLQEYAFGTDPDVPSPEAKPVAGTTDSEVTLTYQLQRTRTDLKVLIEESTDLKTWTPANVASTDTVADNQTIRTYRAHVPSNGAPQKFLRLTLTPL